MRIFLLLLVLAAGAASGEDWYPSKHGAGDTLGAINFLSPDKVVQGVINPVAIR